MKESLETHGISHLIKRLLGGKKGLNPHQRFPDAYFKTIWVTKQMHQDIELIGKIEGISKKAVADKLLAIGISYYMSEYRKNMPKTNG